MKTLTFLFILLTSVLLAQEVPLVATSVSATTQITWKWHTSEGATGYKWNITDNYATAIDMGTDTVKIDTALTPNTSYTQYVWAYNACGYSSLVSSTSSTLDDFVCGEGKTVTHTAGVVAPVTKTVTYGTVTDTSGGTLKCWITQNLGADQQATAVSDATGTFAGWYWQFNHKQGYKYDDYLRTPNTTWISPITDSLNWDIANDPCTIELGIGWRVPTIEEWVNVSGGWVNWDGSWSSVLKIHAAGDLSINTGILSYRGSNGYYWSSSDDGTMGGGIYFNANTSSNNSYAKSIAMPLRCINETAFDTCTEVPGVPTVGTHTYARTQISWRWNEVFCAFGYKWNTVNNYATATDLGTSLIRIETGLTCNTAYTRYVWAYNDLGNSTVLTIIDTTLSCPSVWTTCGDSIEINHVAGVVAPVTKTITYGTTNGLTGDTTKCWITSNLGADHQATSVNDTTEESAGWYWQFNHKQGYKYSTTRTPDSTWINTINENQEWDSINDPCACELGAGWRVPTKREWADIDQWTTSTQAYASLLKLHGAGRLNYGSGSLSHRGSIGYYWSSQQAVIPGYSRSFYLSARAASTNAYYKTYGFSIRCVHD